MTDVSGIAYSLGGKAAWRREKAERYPEDVRNLEAAEMLESLAAQVNDIDPELLERFASLQDGDSDVDEIADEVMTDIGFRRRYVKIDDMIRDIIDLR